MDCEDLFSNFSNSNKTSFNKNEKQYTGKKRIYENPIEIESFKDYKQPKLEDLDMGQNLEYEKNNKIPGEDGPSKENEINMNELMDRNNIESLQKEKEYLRNQIIKVFPDIDNELKLLKNIQTKKDVNKNKSNKKKIMKEKEDINNEKINIDESLSSNSQEITKLSFDYQKEKEKYDNLIQDKEIDIDKEDFKGGYHENIHLKSIPYDPSKKLKKYSEISNLAYKFPFKLDEFQEKAILCLENRESVLVSAHTSAGKTVVAQYAIAMAKRDHQRVIYTSPIKALSNQKYRDLKDVFEDVGLMTGDVTRNENASCIVMTTEILRNMLFKGSEITKEIAWVIFDEVHYMRDRERGVVWEETIILLSNKINYVFLSATIPNAREFGMWITKIKKQPCNVVYTSFRPTPLRHYIFPIGMNNTSIFLTLDSKTVNIKGNKQNVEEIFYDKNYSLAFDILNDSKKLENCSQKKNKNKKNESKLALILLIKFLYKHSFCPLIVFAFSKRECEQNALDLYKYNPLQRNKFDKKNLKLINKEGKQDSIDLTNDEEKQNIEKIFYNSIGKLSKEDQELPNIVNFLPLLKRGIGVHHGGMLPILKECVELLFQEGFIKVLFSTETFSMGINMPAKTVLFTSLKKFDGEYQRYLGGGEYTQMAGRAGRRGIDKEGNVIVMVDKFIDKKECEKIIKGKSAPLISSFQLSYNQLANLIRIEGLEPSHILSQSFSQFQKEKSIPILRTKLAKLYNDYLSEGFDTDKKEAEIKQIYEIEETLMKLKNEFRRKVFIPKEIRKFISIGRIIKLKYFGYGLVINCKDAQAIQINNKDNLNIITEYEAQKNKEKEENILQYDEEDLYLKNIGYEEEENSNLDNNENNDYVIDKKLLSNKDYVNNVISNTVKDDENKMEVEPNNNKIEANSNDENYSNEVIIDVLVSLKNYSDVNGCLSPGNFEESRETFYGIVPFTITMIEEIYEVRAKMIVDLKDIKLIDDYGKRLKEIVNRFKGKLPVLDIVKKNNITDEKIIKLTKNISDLEEKYTNLKEDYINNYGGESDILDNDLKKFVERSKIQKEIKKIITRIEAGKSLVLNDELINMQRVLRRLDFVTKDEILTQKGQIICDISGADELLTAELLFNGFFKDLTLEEIGAALYCCLSKENNSKKEDEKSSNKDRNAQHKINKIYESIKKKAKYIGEILEECRILGKGESEKYVDNFNDIYMMPIYKWVNGISFSDLIKEFNTLYEGSLIRVIRRIEEFSKSFVLSAQTIGDNNLQNKLVQMENKIKRGLPFTASLYLETTK